MSVEKQAPSARAAWVGAGITLALPWGIPHQQGAQLHSSLQKYFACMRQHKLVAKHLYSFKTSPFSGIHDTHFKASATWLLQDIFHIVKYNRSRVFCNSSDNDLHGYQEHSPAVTLSQALLLLHRSRQPAASPSSVPVLGELPLIHTACNPSWKDGVYVIVALQGIPSEPQLNN